jgi:hypothetical protein
MSKDDEPSKTALAQGGPIAAKPIASAREARLAAALRDNLRRRKGLARSSASAPLARDPGQD